MKGKKNILLGCRCCRCFDFRDSELEKEHKKEIKAYVAQLERAPDYESDG